MHKQSPTAQKNSRSPLPWSSAALALCQLWLSACNTTGHGSSSAAAAQNTASRSLSQPLAEAIVCELAGSDEAGTSYGLVASSSPDALDERRRLVVTASFPYPPFADQLVLDAQPAGQDGYELEGGGRLKVSLAKGRVQVKVDWQGRRDLAAYWTQLSGLDLLCDNAAAPELGPSPALTMSQLHRPGLKRALQRARFAAEAEVGRAVELVHLSGETVASANACEGFVSLRWIFSAGSRQVQVEDRAEVAGADCVYDVRTAASNAAAAPGDGPPLAAVGELAQLSLGIDAAVVDVQVARPRFIRDGYFAVVAVEGSSVPYFVFRGQMCGQPLEHRMDAATGDVVTPAKEPQKCP